MCTLQYSLLDLQYPIIFKILEKLPECTPRCRRPSSTASTPPYRASRTDSSSSSMSTGAPCLFPGCNAHAACGARVTGVISDRAQNAVQLGDRRTAAALAPALVARRRGRDCAGVDLGRPRDARQLGPVVRPHARCTVILTTIIPHFHPLSHTGKPGVRPRGVRRNGGAGLG